MVVTVYGCNRLSYILYREGETESKRHLLAAEKNVWYWLM